MTGWLKTCVEILTSVHKHQHKVLYVYIYNVTGCVSVFTGENAYGTREKRCLLPSKWHRPIGSQSANSLFIS